MLPRRVTSFPRPVPTALALGKDNRMVMLAEHYDFIIGGDPDRDTIDLVPRQATLALLIVSARRTTLRRTGAVWWVLRQIR